MRVLACFDGDRGEISVLEELATGARSCYEAGSCKAYVLPGGKIGRTHLALMAKLLAVGEKVLLIGCRGGTLATELYRQVRRVTVVDANPMKFDLAHEFFWMPSGIRCVTADPRRFLHEEVGVFDAIGVNVGVRGFSCEDAADQKVWARFRARLRAGGRIAVNIPNRSLWDPMPDRLARTLENEDLNVWIFDEEGRDSRNVVVLGSAPIEDAEWQPVLADSRWIGRRSSY